MASVLQPVFGQDRAPRYFAVRRGVVQFRTEDAERYGARFQVETNAIHSCYDAVLFMHLIITADRLCGLVVRVPVYRSKGHGIDSRRYQIF
jgi:hypothetical protein